ncbi:5010_t:CDS:2 [Paraglomus occultum]|uniref:5010_t:CDS:1 n=1 Tax=Paraglomus occultum TaxID=144539 RepID=A0A9N9F380_9GLOM|nr:5010_t:CDS:2 [Paraglomus occultum]
MEDNDGSLLHNPHHRKSSSSIHPHPLPALTHTPPSSAPTTTHSPASPTAQPVSPTMNTSQPGFAPPITIVFDRLCSGSLGMSTPVHSPHTVAMDTTEDGGEIQMEEEQGAQERTHRETVYVEQQKTGKQPERRGSGQSSRNRKKRRQQYSYRTPDSHRVPDSPNSLGKYDTEDEFGDGMSIDDNRCDTCVDCDMGSSVDSLKKLLMTFPAMSPARLDAILPILLDNDIDHPDILLLIENEQYLRDLHSKNGSELSRGNCLSIWHGIQEHRQNASMHTPKSFTSSSYSPPAHLTSLRSDIILTHPPRSKKARMESAMDRDDDSSSVSNLSLSSLDHSHDHNHHTHNHGHQLRRHNSPSPAPTPTPTPPPTSFPTTTRQNRQRVKAPKLNMSTIEEVHTRVDIVLAEVARENERRRQIASTKTTGGHHPRLKFEDFVGELKQAHKIPVAFGTLRDMRFAYILKKLNPVKYDEVLASRCVNVTEFYRRCQEVCEENFQEDALESALPWLELKSKLYYK